MMPVATGTPTARAMPLFSGLHRVNDLREVPFRQRDEISDRELVALADADVPGAETEISLRAWLKAHPATKRESVKPHCAP